MLLANNALKAIVFVPNDIKRNQYFNNVQYVQMERGSRPSSNLNLCYISPKLVCKNVYVALLMVDYH